MGIEIQETPDKRENPELKAMKEEHQDIMNKLYGGYNLDALPTAERPKRLANLAHFVCKSLSEIKSKLGLLENETMWGEEFRQAASEMTTKYRKLQLRLQLELKQEMDKYYDEAVQYEKQAFDKKREALKVFDAESIRDYHFAVLRYAALKYGRELAEPGATAKLAKFALGADLESAPDADRLEEYNKLQEIITDYSAQLQKNWRNYKETDIALDETFRELVDELSS